MDVPEKRYAQGSEYDDQALQDVLAMEQEAQAIIRDAEQQARRLVAEARSGREKLIITSREAVEREALARVAAERQATEQMVSEIERGALEKVTKWLGLAEQRMDGVVEAVAQLIANGSTE